MLLMDYAKDWNNSMIMAVLAVLYLSRGAVVIVVAQNVRLDKQVRVGVLLAHRFFVDHFKRPLSLLLVAITLILTGRMAWRQLRRSHFRWLSSMTSPLTMN